jgi:Holliday junction resolvase RusA-like endonuclease
MIEIRLDGDPVAKGRHRHRLNTKTGKIFTHADPKTARFEDRLAWAAQVIMAGRPLLTGPLVVIVDAYRAVPASWSNKRQRDAETGRVRPTTKPDADNFLKICCDALNRVVWVDDSQIVDARVRKFYDSRPRFEIRIDNLSTIGL